MKSIAASLLLLTLLSTAAHAQRAAKPALVFQPLRDPQSGMISAELPLPADWRITRGLPGSTSVLEGPNGVKVVDYPLQMFMLPRDPRMQQLYAQSGQVVRPLPNVESLVQTDLVPWAASRGFRLVKSYSLPEIARVDQQYDDKLFKVMPARKSFWAIGSEWVDAQGKTAFLLMRGQATTPANGDLNWGYYCTSLESTPEFFQVARRHLVHAIVNARHNPEQIAAYNQREAQAVQRSQAAHGARMQQNQQAFDAQQRAFTQRSNAAHDALQQGHDARNAASDRSHQRTINTIRGEETVTNPATGQRHQVEGGAQQYWLNNQGQYIPGNGTYDPNADSNVNGTQWQEGQIEP